MFVATLLCNPAAPALDPALVESLRNAWGGGDIEWLAPDIAAEFELARVPENRWDVWKELQNSGVDLIVQPRQGRRKKMLIADMDSTMIQQECIDELADVAGVGDRVKDITARAMNGDLDFEAALKERVSLLKGMDSAIIDTVLNGRITLTPGGAELVATMRSHGGYAVLVSGGFTHFAEPVAASLGFDESQANTLVIEDGKLTGDVMRPILGREAKIDALQQVSARLGLSPDQVMAVGDGANDLGMLRLAGAGVALHAKPSVAAECDIRINFGDLTALLYIQGYRQDEFTR